MSKGAHTHTHTHTHTRINICKCITPLGARVCVRARTRARACSLSSSLPPVSVSFSLARARAPLFPSLSSSLSLSLSQGHERGSSLAARAKALEQRLLKRVDPIDLTFLAPLLHANRSKAYQRHSVMLGALVQVHICPFPPRFVFFFRSKAYDAGSACAGAHLQFVF